ncbi:MAG: hypothetical protein HY694_09220 [Deltaproteobacteria bacterium]|nr:hypothetical protein [Deltaproteobacteria bacterium]
MKVAVCVKAVPTRIDPSEVIEKNGFFTLTGNNAIINESDEYAVEEAVALKRRLGCEVVAISVGGPAAQEILCKVFAKGVDRTLRVDASFLNPARTALTLSSLIKREGCEMILTGVESADVMASCVGGAIAGLLRIPFCFAVTGIELVSKDRLVVTKEVGGGASQKVEIELPVVLAIQPGIRPLSYPPAALVILARRKPAEVIRLRDLGIEEDLGKRAEWAMEKVLIPEKGGSRSVTMLDGSVRDAAKRLLELAKNKLAGVESP